MKRKIIKYIAFFISITFIFYCKSEQTYAYSIKEEKPPAVNARYSIAVDAKTKVVLYEKDSQALVPMASTTKIMTALVALKYGKVDSKFTISSKSAGIRGSTVGYKKDESITLKELLYGLMLRSGNDAAIAIAEGISGSVEEFLKLMNEYAIEIGMTNTHFESPHGLDSDFHYTTAYDLALITTEAKELPLFNEIVQTKDIDSTTSGFTRSYHNINKILWLLPFSDGVKTGYTGDAGKCLVTSVKINGNDVIIVVLNSVDRWNVTKKITEYIEKSYTYQKISSKDQVVSEVQVKAGKEKLKLINREDILVPIKNGSAFKVKIINPKNLNAPIIKTSKCGSLNVFQEDKLIFSKELYASNNVRKKNLIERLFGKTA